MPRDPKRITSILAKLHRAWGLVPDQRLGQFLSNLQWPGRLDVFYVEDETLDRLLDEFLKARRGFG